MERLVLFLFVAVLMVGCATAYYSSEGNPISKEKMVQLRSTVVKAHLVEHRYHVFIDRVYPMRGPTAYLQNDWELEVSGDSVELFPPYFSRAYYIPYRRGGGLSLVELLTSYRKEPMKGGRRVFMTTRSDFGSYQIVLEIFGNATVSLVINPSEKEAISFSGVVELNDIFTPKGQKASKKYQTIFMKL